LKKREPFLSKTPATFLKIPNRSSGVGRKVVEAEAKKTISNFSFRF
jgi:hypothetical protein